MRVNETLRTICTKFCTLVGIRDVITYANFGIDHLMHFLLEGIKFCPFPLTLIVVLMGAQLPIGACPHPTRRLEN